jgi:hypothetical protein
MNFVRSERNVKLVPVHRLEFRTTVIDFNQEWRTLDVEATQIKDQWQAIEREAQEYAEFPWKSALSEERLRVKIDDRTMFFDSNSELIPGCQKVSVMTDVTCIIEIKSVYNFKGSSGLTCRVHQLKTHGGCLL